MPTGGEACRSTNNLITTIAASGPGAGPEYALEGSVFMAGALMQWLRDDMGIIDDVAETSAIARSVNSTDGVYAVSYTHLDVYKRQVKGQVKAGDEVVVGGGMGGAVDGMGMAGDGGMAAVDAGGSVMVG